MIPVRYVVSAVEAAVFAPVFERSITPCPTLVSEIGPGAGELPAFGGEIAQGRVDLALLEILIGGVAPARGPIRSDQGEIGILDARELGVLGAAEGKLASVVRALEKLAAYWG